MTIIPEGRAPFKWDRDALRQFMHAHIWGEDAGEPEPEPEADPRRYLTRLRDLAERNPCRLVIVWARVSKEHQRVNLPGQVFAIVEACLALGYRVLRVFAFVDEANGPETFRYRKQAGRLADRRGAVIVGESANRFLRFPGQNSRNWKRAPLPKQWVRLQRMTWHAPLATILRADASPEEQRRQESSRRRFSTDSTSSPTERRRVWSPFVLRLLKAGVPIRQTAALTPIKVGTVSRWSADQKRAILP